jgi:hypothetical protein
VGGEIVPRLWHQTAPNEKEFELPLKTDVANGLRAVDRVPFVDDVMVLLGACDVWHADSAKVCLFAVVQFEPKYRHWQRLGRGLFTFGERCPHFV